MARPVSRYSRSRGFEGRTPSTIPIAGGSHRTPQPRHGPGGALARDGAQGVALWIGSLGHGSTNREVAMKRIIGGVCACVCVGALVLPVGASAKAPHHPADLVFLGSDTAGELTWVAGAVDSTQKCTAKRTV